RVCGLEMRTCPLCRRGSLHIIAVITQESVITRILRHLQLASVPPPMAPARVRQELCTFDEAHAPWCGLVSDVRVAAPSLALLRRRHPLPPRPPPCHNQPSRGPRPRAPLWLQPPPSCTACPGRAVRCCGPLQRAAARWGRVQREAPAVVTGELERRATGE